MDGRTQLPVIKYLMDYFGTAYVDSVTEPGPILFLAEKQQSPQTESILQRVDISINKHKSCGIGIVAHYNCAGNPVEKETQLKQLAISIDFIKTKYPNTKVIGLWADEKFSVTQI